MTEMVPWSPTQRRVFSAVLSDASTVTVHGPVQSGKSMSTVFAFAFLLASEWGGRDAIIGSRTTRQLQGSVIKYLEQFCAATGVAWIPRRDHYEMSSLHGAPNRLFPLVGSDKSSAGKARSYSVAAALLDEVTLLPPDFVRAVADRCSVPGATLVLSTNPAGPAHPIYLEYVQGADGTDRVEIPFALSDNPSLSESYIRGLHRRYHGAMLRRMVYGEWSASEGLIYPLVAEVVGTPPDERQVWRYMVGVDYAHSSVTHAVLVALYLDGTAWVVDEWRYDGRDAGQLAEAEQARRIYRWIGDRNVSVICVDPSAQSMIQALRLASTAPIVVEARNEVTDGIQYVRSRMEGGYLGISSRCIHLLQEISNYRWDDNAGARGDDRPLKIDDHGPDALRYVLWTTGSRHGRELRVVRRHSRVAV
ncbi:MAG: hypothetical protein OXQ93_13945 [Gemmatimonadota bacterium]|nr:hypothetical protein [Gemmatimonadota bacterium]